MLVSAGSSPVTPIMACSSVVERLTVNQNVVGSIPTLPVGDTWLTLSKHSIKRLRKGVYDRRIEELRLVRYQGKTTLPCVRLVEGAVLKTVWM